jgi:hypothetical protein
MKKRVLAMALSIIMSASPAGRLAAHLHRRRRPASTAASRGGIDGSIHSGIHSGIDGGIQGGIHSSIDGSLHGILFILRKRSSQGNGI